ncbi:helix-turn-helix domain-containing protein [Kineosporia sp. R_H_3]|uniref:helix-turn-helix domain-containing protein n=1 Tax=Kineosporia sp. R_H_3 TaxID=1961848 RepID=UPI0018E9DF7F|nr:helix-turn-helix domain-containing protein [Kineosporia sp. R_H_3]
MNDRGEASTGAAALVLEERFSIVPEWVLDADVSDAAVRLYAVLLRYGQSSGQRMPSRRTLADRLRKKSVDSVDRALRELVGIGAVEVTRRCQEGVNLTNRYLVRATRPGAPVRPGRGGGGRTDAATPVTDHGRQPAGAGGVRVSADWRGRRGGRRDAATPGRTDAARVAAPVRPDPEFFTQSTNPPPRPSTPTTTPTTTPSTTPTTTPATTPATTPTLARAEVARLLGPVDLEQIAGECRQLRADLGLPSRLWTADHLAQVLLAAVRDHDRPAESAVAALLTVAADPATRTPARLACPGPWWETPGRPTDGESASHAPPDSSTPGELEDLERRLAETDGARVLLQRRAREALEREGRPLTRLTVARRAVQILEASVP